MKETLERVDHAADSLGAHPSDHARSLADHGGRNPTERVDAFKEHDSAARVVFGIVWSKHAQS